MTEPAARRPLLFRFDDFLDRDTRAALTEALAVPRLLDAGLTVRHGPTGRTAEVPPSFHPLLGATARRVEALVGLTPAVSLSFRVRHAAPGDSHPPHLDAYEIDGAVLVATAMLWLEVAGCVGGETIFPEAAPALRLAPAAGALAVWFNYDAEGCPEPASLHAMTRVETGARLTMNLFVYARRTDVPKAGGLTARLGARPEVWSAERPVLTCVDDTAAPESAAALARACTALGVDFRHVFADEVDPRAPALDVGEMLYCVSTSAAAERVERQLWQPGVATFHRGPDGPFCQHTDPLRALSRAGLPVPRFVVPARGGAVDAATLVEWLGGLPVVVKAPGGEGGVGTLRADSLPGLAGTLDLMFSRGLTPVLMSYVPDAMHLRLVVVGDRVVTAYRNPVAEGDFRSRPSGDAADYEIEVDPEVAAVAVAAAHCVGTDFAGVDVLAHPSGRFYLLEANSPCYFPQAEAFGRVDVARAMVEALLARRASCRIPALSRP